MELKDISVTSNPELLNFWIETYTGRKLYLAAPAFLTIGATDEANEATSHQIHLDDIVQGLTLRCRYNSQCKFHWSVAAHSLLVWRICSALYGETNHDLMGGCLLHDGHEAYGPDYTSPFKAMLRYMGVHILDELNDLIQEHVYGTFNISLSETEEKIIKKCDLIARVLEADKLMHSKGVNWQGHAELIGSIPPLDVIKFPVETYENNYIAKVYREAVNRYV